MAAADRANGSRRPTARCWRSSRRACAARSRSSPETPGDRPAGAGRRRQRDEGDGVQGAAPRRSRWRARPARRRCREPDATRGGATSGNDPRLVRRLRAGGAARASRSRCWSSTAATAVTWRRRSPWRSSTTTSSRSRRAKKRAPRVAAGGARPEERRAMMPCRLAEAALPVRLDADAGRAGGGRNGAHQPVERRPRATVDQSLLASRSRGWGWARRCSWSSRPSTTARSCRMAYMLLRRGSRCSRGCCCSARWSAVGGAGSTSVRSTFSRQSWCSS